MDIKQDIIKRLGPDIIDNDKPSQVVYWPNGKIRYFKWYDKCGNYHRDKDLPAYEEFYESGIILSRQWYKNGVLVKREEYRTDGRLIEYIDDEDLLMDYV